MDRSAGFTLLELMIVIAVVGVTLALGVPSYKASLLSAARAEASTSLYSALVQARSEAIVRNATVTVCPRLPTTSSTFPKCNATAGWTQGWIVYANGTGAAGEPASATDILGVGEATQSAFVVDTNPTGTALVQFSPSGRRALVATLTLTLCQGADRTWEGRQITVEANGRVSLTAYPSSAANPCP